MSKRRRIAWLSDSDEARAQALGDRKLGFGVFLAAKADVMDAPAAARQRGQRVDSGLCAAEFVDQGPERRWTDILASDQPGAGLVLAFANARLLASHEPADIVGVANIKKNREQQEQRSDSPLPRQREHA